MSNLLTKRDYEMALASQNAPNLMGISKSFALVLDKIHAAEGRNAVDRHPITRLYMEQMMMLSGCGMGDTDSYQAAYKACEAKVQELQAAA